MAIRHAGFRWQCTQFSDDASTGSCWIECQQMCFRGKSVLGHGDSMHGVIHVVVGEGDLN